MASRTGWRNHQVEFNSAKCKCLPNRQVHLRVSVTWRNFATWRISPLVLPSRVVNLRAGPAEILSRTGPVILNFISIRIFKRFFKENCNFIINTFQIKYCSFKKIANIGEIFAEHWQKTARPGPAEIRVRPARPSPLTFAGRNSPARPGPICQA